MASVSFEVARTGGQINVLATGSDPVVLGTAAPTTANTLQLRVDLAGGWTRKEVWEALEKIEIALLANPDIV